MSAQLAGPGNQAKQCTMHVYASYAQQICVSHTTSADTDTQDMMESRTGNMYQGRDWVTAGIAASPFIPLHDAPGLHSRCSHPFTCAVLQSYQGRLSLASGRSDARLDPAVQSWGCTSCPIWWKRSCCERCISSVRCSASPLLSSAMTASQVCLLKSFLSRHLKEAPSCTAGQSAHKQMCPRAGWPRESNGACSWLDW